MTYKRDFVPKIILLAKNYQLVWIKICASYHTQTRYIIAHDQKMEKFPPNFKALQCFLALQLADILCITLISKRKSEILRFFKTVHFERELVPLTDSTDCLKLNRKSKTSKHLYQIVILFESIMTQSICSTSNT